MEFNRRLSSFIRLGEKLRGVLPPSADLSGQPFADAITRSYAANGWFTKDQVVHALNAIGEMLRDSSLEAWAEPYRSLMPVKRLRVGCVMAGNIPAVGFHDMLCVLMSGHTFIGKLSSDDGFLLPAMASLLVADDPGWKERIFFADGRLEKFDAIIATGGDNAARYFQYYFGRYPSIIRSNRNSVAVITGSEGGEELKGIADDMLRYYGLGCRSVSHLLVPEGYDFTRLSEASSGYSGYADHHKYRNNYDYLKAIYMMNSIPFFDNGFMLFRQHDQLSSPVSEIHYSTYRYIDEVNSWLRGHHDSIQCVVSTVPLTIPVVPPGMAQKPGLADYADGVDTMKFLLSVISDENSLQIKY